MSRPKRHREVRLNSLTDEETARVRRWIEEERENRRHRIFYSTERHWRNTGVYWVTPYDSDADTETDRARPLVIQQEGRAVRLILGGFDYEDDLPDLHIELRPDGTWSIQVRHDEGDPMFLVEIDKAKGRTKLVSDGMFLFEGLDHETIEIQH